MWRPWNTSNGASTEFSICMPRYEQRRDVFRSYTAGNTSRARSPPLGASSKVQAPL
jgi:hypothetical protein